MYSRRCIVLHLLHGLSENYEAMNRQPEKQITRVIFNHATIHLIRIDVLLCWLRFMFSSTFPVSVSRSHYKLYSDF